MQELIIISGKGGTGKTSLTAAFAALAENMVLCDTDVDAADLHLLMNPEIVKTTGFQGGSLAVIDQEKCIGCGLCLELCRFDAVKLAEEQYSIEALSCEGCGVCVDLCPEQAIDFPLQTNGEWFISRTTYGPMIHARLGIAEENSGKLVSLLRREARELAEERGLDLLLTDGPPGIGCPVIASISGATAVIIVTEPTVSGLHDMERVAGLAAHFKVPAMVCVNKFDLNIEQTRAIEEFSKKKNISVLGRIPFDRSFTEAMVQGKTIMEYDPTSESSLAAKEIWDKIITSPMMNEEKNKKKMKEIRL